MFQQNSDEAHGHSGKDVTVFLREAAVADVPALAKVHRAARGHAMPWLPHVHTPEEDLVFFRDAVLPKQIVLIADVSGHVAGFVAYAQGWLNHLYVAPEMWRVGAGSLLLSEAQAASITLQLWTFQGNMGARAFYARHGFAEVEFTDGMQNEERTPDVRMIWHRT